MSMPEHVVIGHIFAQLEERLSFPFVQFRRFKGWGGSEKGVPLPGRSSEPRELRRFAIRLLLWAEQLEDWDEKKSQRRGKSRTSSR